MAFVYRHIRLDKNEPFYIGIGKNKYRPAAKQNRNDIWNKITSKTGYEVEIIFDDVSWQFACAKEIELIKLYGRLNTNTGCLANMTDGGDGNLGLKHSKEALIKILESSSGRRGYWKGRKMTDEFKMKVSIGKKGKPHLNQHPFTDRMREILISRNYGNKNHLGKKHTDESKSKMSAAKKGIISKTRKPVLQFSLSGDFIMEHASINGAAIAVGGYDSEIINVCKGVAKTSKGYKWKYK